MSNKPKQETIEEAEITFANEIKQISDYDKGRWYGRIEGANWQQKQLTLSNEEIDKIAKEHILYNDSKRQWFIEGMKIYRDKIKINK